MPTTIHGLPDIYRPIQVAELLKCSRRAVYGYIEAGVIPARKIGDSLMIFGDDLRAALQSLPRAGK